MAREVSCVFIAAYCALLLVALKRLGDGREAFEAFLQLLATPASMIFHLLVLVFVVYHSTSWFNVTPKAMPIQIGNGFLPGRIIVAAHYAAWFAVSLLLLLLAGAP
jgi:fumarate reductase subunit C